MTELLKVLMQLANKPLHQILCWSRERIFLLCFLMLCIFWSLSNFYNARIFYAAKGCLAVTRAESTLCVVGSPFIAPAMASLVA